MKNLPPHRWYVQIKGTGPNPLTETGKDGLATLTECLKERDASELLAAKGIPTSRVLAIVSFKQHMGASRLFGAVHHRDFFSIKIHRCIHHDG